jgi:Zn ribbon nucleic-acid-binding protein
LHDALKTSSPECPKCRSAEFELRVLREDGLAAARCVNCAADYLLLDSKDYWFDVIQKGYPRLTRCSCRNESFRLRIDYSFRADGDIDYIEVHSTCSACGKARRQLDFEVDYSGTAHLFKRPLVPCKNPKILYDLKNLSLLVTLPDMGRIVDHLAREAKCGFVSHVRRGDGWKSIRQGASGTKATISRGGYLFIYASPSRIEVPEEQVSTVEKEDAFWKRAEVIRIGTKTHVCTYRLGRGAPDICYCSDPPTDAGYSEVGLSFDIDFSNEFVRGEASLSKSEPFQQVTAGLIATLKGEFVSWRGPHCFDNPDVNVRVFGDRFRKKPRSR